MKRSGSLVIPVAASLSVAVWARKRLLESECSLDTSSLSVPKIADTVGNTALIYLPEISKRTGRHIYAKAEFMNPTSSVKDRAAKCMIDEAEGSGFLPPGGYIVEGTGGNTGVALAQLGCSKGYKVILTMPECIGKEKIEYCRRFGATVYLQPMVPFSDQRHYAHHAATLAKQLGGLHTNQFENLANFRAHFGGTGPEIWSQTRGKIDAFVCSAGTGGTIAGVSAFLKQVHPSVKCYLVDPSGSSLFSYVTEKGGSMAATPDSTLIEGIGIGRITQNFKQAQLDGAYRGTDAEAVEMAHYLLRNEGLFVGPSAALNVVGAVKVARSLPPGSTIVTILCDGGERYLSTFYRAEWLAEKGLAPIATGNSLQFVK